METRPVVLGYIAKGRVAEMQARGWTVVDTLADRDEGEWSVLMEGPELEPLPIVSIGQAVVAAIIATEEAWRAHG